MAAKPAYRWLWVLVAGLLLAAFFPTFQNGFTNWDDHLQVTANPDLRLSFFEAIPTLFSSFYVGMYQPLTTLLYWFELNLGGLHPMLFHTVSLLLHGLNCWLVYQLLKRLSVPEHFAYLGVLIFAVHPLQVEPVAWVSARSTLLSTAFYLLSVLAYLRYRDQDKMTNLLWCGGYFVLALFSKSIAVTLPVMLVVLDLSQQRKIDRKAILEKVPFFAISVAFGLVTIVGRAEVEHLSDLSVDFNAGERLLILCHSFIFYPFKMLWPGQVSAFYAYPLAGQSLPLSYWIAPLGVLAYGWFAFRALIKRSVFLFPLLFYAINILPVLQIIPVGSQPTADRYFYLAGLGLILTVIMLLARWSRATNPEKIPPQHYALLIIPLILAALTFVQTSTWGNDKTLWDSVLAQNKNVPVAWNNRGIVRKQAGNFQGAIADFNEAIQLKPHYADAYSNRGDLRSQMGDLNGALADFDQAILHQPQHADALFNRGNIRIKQGNLSAAIADLTASIAVTPQPDAYTNRGLATIQLGRLDQGLLDLDSALQLNPNYAGAYFLKGQVYLQIGDRERACAQFGEAARLNYPQALQAQAQHCR